MCIRGSGRGVEMSLDKISPGSGNVMCVSVPKECVYGLPNLSAKQRDWLSHTRPAPCPFPLFLFPGLISETSKLKFSFKASKPSYLGHIYFIYFMYKYIGDLPGVPWWNIYPDTGWSNQPTSMQR